MSVVFPLAVTPIITITFVFNTLPPKNFIHSLIVTTYIFNSKRDKLKIQHPILFTLRYITYSSDNFSLKTECGQSF